MDRNDEENELYNLALDIKSVYKSRVTQLSRDKKCLIPKQYDDYEKVWRKAALVCKTYGVSPERLVDIALEVYLGSSKYRSIVTPMILYDNRTKVAIKRQTIQQTVDPGDTMVLSSFSNVDAETIANIQNNLYQEELKTYVTDRFEFLNDLRKCQNKISQDRVMQIVRMEAFDIPCWLRVVATNGEDPIVNKRFGKQALYELEQGIKGLKEIIESRGRGINVRDIIHRLKQ